MYLHRSLLVTISVMSAIAANAQAGQGRINGDPSRDVRQTMQARKLLAEDPELAAWNIGVMVKDRVAVLWGPAPSAEVAFRAELCLKTMFELVEVRNEMIVCESLEPTVRPLKIDNIPRYVPELLPPKLPDPSHSKAPPTGTLLGPAKKGASQTTSAFKKSAEEIKLPPPIVDADAALLASIRVFLQSKSAFAVVQVSVKDGRVYLSAPNQNTDVLHEAARGIARLPNVDGVVLAENAPPK